MANSGKRRSMRRHRISKQTKIAEIRRPILALILGQTWILISWATAAAVEGSSVRPLHMCVHSCRVLAQDFRSIFAFLSNPSYIIGTGFRLKLEFKHRPKENRRRQTSQHAFRFTLRFMAVVLTKPIYSCHNIVHGIMSTVRCACILHSVYLED